MTPARLALRIGRTRRAVVVASFAEASRVFAELRDRSGLGASTMPEGRVCDPETGALVASLSYNGKVWDRDDRWVFDPFDAEVRT